MFTFEIQRAGAVEWPSGKPDLNWYRWTRSFATREEAEAAATHRRITGRHPVYTRVIST